MVDFPRLVEWESVARDAPPLPSMVVSKHIPSAKETPVCGIYKVDQSVTERYNLVEPGLPVSPLQGGPAFLLPAPGSYAISYVQIGDLRGAPYVSDR